MRSFCSTTRKRHQLYPGGNHFDSLRFPSSSGSGDQIPGNFTPAEIMVFRRESKVAERAIRFPETFAEIEAIGKARSRNGCACDLPPALAELQPDI
jgi:hypothetical protein